MKRTLEMINRMQADGIVSNYAIGGAVGATFYLEPGATLDVDIFLNLPATSGVLLVTLEPVYEYLKAQGSHVEGEHIVLGDWPVQFLPVSDELEKEGLREAIETEVEGVKTRVMSAEHLVAIALRTGRPKDYARILQFLEQDAVDKDKLKVILRRHRLMPRLEQFESKYLEGGKS